MKNKKPKILILGADGFIGSNLIESLLREKKYQLVAFDLFKDGVSRNLESCRDEIKIIPGNFLNKEDIKKALKGVSFAFHFISLTTPGSSVDDPLIDVDTNIRGTISLLDECVHAKVKKVIFSSSGGAIYGNQEKETCSETDRTNPISPYAISKLTIEKYLEYYKIHHGLDYLVLRYSNPYGPRQNIVGSQGIIPIFLNLVKKNKPITIFGDGENIRDYIYIDDAINMTKLIFEDKTRYNLYNIGSGNGFSINEVIKIMEEVVGKKIKVNRQPSRDIDVEKILLNTKRIFNEIEHISRTTLKKGIRKTWEWINVK